MNAIEQLKSVLCDQEGKCCIWGSDADRAIVDRALEELTTPQQAEAVPTDAELIRCWVEKTPGGEIDGIASMRKVLKKFGARQQAEAVPSDVLSTEWVPCIKRPVIVHVRNQRPGEQHVSTREGISPVKPDDLIMRGVSGEEYPIGRAIFEQTYDIAAQGEKP